MEMRFRRPRTGPTKYVVVPSMKTLQGASPRSSAFCIRFGYSLRGICNCDQASVSIPTVVFISMSVCISMSMFINFSHVMPGATIYFYRYIYTRICIDIYIYMYIRATEAPHTAIV